jgi:cysteine synthase A
MRAISTILGRRVGGSTGTNIWACAKIIEEMASIGATGSVVTLLCDGGDRYGQTYYQDDWLASHGLEWQGAESRILALFGQG